MNFHDGKLLLQLKNHFGIDRCFEPYTLYGRIQNILVQDGFENAQIFHLEILNDKQNYSRHNIKHESCYVWEIPSWILRESSRARNLIACTFVRPNNLHFVQILLIAGIYVLINFPWGTLKISFYRLRPTLTSNVIINTYV